MEHRDLAYDQPPTPEFQLVKCVVVGDSGAGKTRLICARACGTTYGLEQLMQSHVPTVWAIDHYRKNKEVMNKSWCVVDGVRLSLQLWDTFGYHDKDRRFAYGRADVILLCFSVVRPRSLRNIVNHWQPEIQRLLPDVPIILCGCQADLRYLYLDKAFKDLDKGPFFREITERDIITPAEGRAVAKEIHAYYYETSVHHQYGITEMFENVIRAALAYKKDKHFWNILNNTLKKAGKPKCQEPLMPPQPLPPDPSHGGVPVETWQKDMERLRENVMCSDVTFSVRGVLVPAHKVSLVIAAEVFEDLFSIELTPPLSEVSEDEIIAPKLPEGTSAPSTRSVSLSRTLSNPTSNNASSQNSKACHRSQSMHLSPLARDTVNLLDNEEVEVSSIGSGENTVGVAEEAATHSCLPKCVLNHPAFRSVELCHVDSPGPAMYQTLVIVDDKITPSVFHSVLHFLYAARCLPVLDLLPDLRRCAEMMGIHELVAMVTNILNNEDFLNVEVTEMCLERRRERMKKLILNKDFLSDVQFECEDERAPAHRSLLAARSDVMASMFNSNFKESSAHVIPLPGVKRVSFEVLQEYLYTGRLPTDSRLDILELLDLIELANRLCLPRLRALLELCCIGELETSMEAGQEVTDETLMLIEAAQFHNADHLARWCLWYVSCHYQVAYKRHSKLMHHLRPDNQIYLSKHRWPPLWYLKELDYYDKCLVELDRQKKKKPMKHYFRRGSDDFGSGCLGFCSRRSRHLRCEPAPGPSTHSGPPVVVTSAMEA